MPVHFRRGRLVAVTTALAAIVAGGWLLHAGASPVGPPTPSAADALPGHGSWVVRPPAARDAGAAPSPSPEPMTYRLPTRIRIRTIGVDAPVALVDLTRSRTLPAPSPTDRNLAGWYEWSAAPGTAGNAVIDGHVDTTKGPAVFYLLGRLHRGDPVDVTRSDGTVAEFTVDGVQLYPRQAVPQAQVFGPAALPQLRLLTCGGQYSPATGYRSTVVVYAHLSATRG